MVWVGDFELLFFARVPGLRLQDLFPKIAVHKPLNGALTTLLGTSPEMLKKKVNGCSEAIHQPAIPGEKGRDTAP